MKRIELVTNALFRFLLWAVTHQENRKIILELKTPTKGIINWFYVE